jgi:hypothetical protein
MVINLKRSIELLEARIIAYGGQRKLSRETGVSRQTMSRFAKGKKFGGLWTEEIHERHQQFLWLRRTS